MPQWVRDGTFATLRALVRLVALLAAAACIAVLSLVAAPGSAGSRAPSRPAGVDPAVLQPLLVSDLAVLRDGRMPLPFGSPAPRVQPTAQAWARDQGWAATSTGADVVPGVVPLDGQAPASWWNGAVASDTNSVAVLAGHPGSESGDVLSASRGAAPPSRTRPASVQPAPTARTVVVLHGIASWYDNGTTAMRWPRGAHVRICGPATCLTRVVTDWGPDVRVYPDRVVDLMPADFVRVCGCTLRIGLTTVTVEILG